MIRQVHLALPEYPKGFHLITNDVLRQVGDLPETGIFHLFIKHSSAGLTLNENADPSVRRDISHFMDDLIPEHHPIYTHTYEGADDMPAHIKASLLGYSISVPIMDGRLALGTWQGIFLCEFRNRGGKRKLIASIYE